MIVIFYINQRSDARYVTFDSDQLTAALGAVQTLRNDGMRHVVISSEMDGSVGKPGVDSVVDGKTPDGEDYDWSKAGRAGRARRSDEFKPVLGAKDGN